MVRRKAEAVHQEFAPIQRAQRRRNIFAQVDRAEELVRSRIDHRNRVRDLVGGVHPVASCGGG